jgi:hypothetical protein
MSQSAAQATAFFREVTRSGVVWYVHDDAGSPAPMTSSGRRAQPFWSSAGRAERAAQVWGGGLRAGSVPLALWREARLTALARDGLLVGVNWTGPRLVGWDFTVDQVLVRLAAVAPESSGGA